MLPDDFPKQPQEISRRRTRLIDKAVANVRNKQDDIREAPPQYIPEMRVRARKSSNTGRIRAIKLTAKSGPIDNNK
jgi:hypothetical protein